MWLRYSRMLALGGVFIMFACSETSAPQGPKWHFDVARYNACLGSVRHVRLDALRRGNHVRTLVVLDLGARCMTSEGVDAIDGQDEIRYAGLKCCLQFLTKNFRVPRGTIVREQDLSNFSVAKYADCVARVRRDFGQTRTKGGKIGRSIALLYEGGVCTSQAGLDVIGGVDIRSLVGADCCGQYFENLSRKPM